MAPERGRTVFTANVGTLPQLPAALRDPSQKHADFTKLCFRTGTVLNATTPAPLRSASLASRLPVF